MRNLLSLVAVLGLYACSRSPGDAAFQDCDDCPPMVRIAGGEFTMGSPGDEPFRGLEPQHKITVPAFALGQYEVTFAEWDACVAAGGCKGPGADDNGWGRGRRPAIEVTWDMAKSYVEWLSLKTGKAYRLPSEAEWEYAARAGTATAFSSGPTITTDAANYDGTTGYGAGPAGRNRQQTLIVGSFRPNGFGLYDMHGNVSEWTEDCWRDGYGEEPAKTATAYLEPDCGEHVVRGGSWSDSPEYLRSAARIGVRRDEQSPSLGFRVARALE